MRALLPVVLALSGCASVAPYADVGFGVADREGYDPNSESGSPVSMFEFGVDIERGPLGIDWCSYTHSSDVLRGRPVNRKKEFNWDVFACGWSWGR